jgi:NADH-quinone oxidoreductase subunit N
MQAIDLLEILPELILLLVICFILLVTPFIKENETNDDDVFFTPKAANLAYQISLVTLLILAFMFALRVSDLPLRIMNGLYIVDPFSNLLLLCFPEK